MPIKQESLNRDLYGLLKSRGYRPDMFTSGGKKVSIPDEAEAFQFEFVKDGKNYGKATVTIDGLHRLIVYYNDDISNSPKSDGQDISWTSLMKHLKRWAKNKALGFQLSDQDDLESDMAKREHNKIEGLNEGYYPMGKKASYSDNVPSTKIILQHSRVMQEGEQRFRHIEKIFVENVNGERFLLPTNKPGLARVYARHIAEGGTPYDERGTHITSLVEEYQKMAGFVRATRNHQFNESAQRLISEGINHYEKLRESLHKMAGKRGYTEYFNNYAPPLMEDEGSADISEMFMQSSLDPRIESVMPILSKLSKNIVETQIKQVDELAEWADSVSENRMADQLGVQVSGAVSDIKSSTPNLDKEGFEEQLWDYLDAQYGASVARMAFNNIDEYWMEYQGVAAEGLDANQEAAGQLGPTEKITKDNPTRGKLVGANESVEQDVAEGTYSKDVERAFPGGKASGVKTGASAPKGTSTMPKDKEKAKGKPAGAITEMDSEGYKGTRDDYELGKGKEHTGKPVTANKAKKDFAKILQKSIDKHNKAKQDTDKKVSQHQVKEGQDTLDAILRIIKK